MATGQPAPDGSGGMSPSANEECPECGPGQGCGGGGGVDAPCNDQGFQSTYFRVFADNPGVSGTTSASGSSPLALDFDIDLSQLEPDTRVVLVQVAYSLTEGSSVTITDNFASGAPGTLDWSREGVRTVNAAMRTPYRVQAQAVFTDPTPPAVAVFSVTGVTVRKNKPDFN